MRIMSPTQVPKASYILGLPDELSLLEIITLAVGLQDFTYSGHLDISSYKTPWSGAKLYGDISDSVTLMEKL
jgi:hypothetical protein